MSRIREFTSLSRLSRIRETTFGEGQLEVFSYFRDYQEFKKQRSEKANYSNGKAVTLSLILDSIFIE